MDREDGEEDLVVGVLALEDLADLGPEVLVGVRDLEVPGALDLEVLVFGLVGSLAALQMVCAI